MFKNYSKAFLIRRRRFIRYLKVGRLLHIVSSAGLVLFFEFAGLALSSLESGRFLWFFIQAYISLYGLVLVFFAQKDALSRFQNYKQAKDLLFEKGFKRRIVSLFIRSRCQRDALGTAAHDLGLKKELKAYYTTMGYRWYHVIPDVVFTKPVRLFSSKFWKSTLSAPIYTSKYFLW